jgi:hypothetical protein
MKGTREKVPFFVALFVVIVVLYAPALGHGLNLDDLEQIRHVQLTGPTELQGYDSHFRPMKNLYFYASLQAFGETFWRWRVLGLAVFLVHMIAVQRYVERMIGSPRQAMAATAVYGLLAVNSAVVVWLSAFHIMVYALFTIVALDSADRAGDGRPGIRYGVSLAAFALSLLSYEAAVTFPVLLALQSWLRRRAYRNRAAYAYLAGVALLVIAWLVLRLRTGARTIAGVENLAMPPGESWWLTLNAARYVMLHAYHVLNPWTTFGVRVPDLPAEHAVAAVGAWAVLIAAFVAAIWSLRRGPSTVAWGFLFFLSGIAPMCNFIPVGSGPVADYYLFLPSLGLVVSGLGLVHALLARQRSNPVRAAVWLVVVLWAVVNVGSTARQRIPAWKDPLSLVGHAHDLYGDSFYHRFLTARLSAGRGSYREAVREYAAALEQAPYHEPSQAGYVVAAINARDLNAAEGGLDRWSPVTEQPRETLRVCRAFVLEARGRIPAAAEIYREIASEGSEANAEAKITALIRLTHLNRKWGVEIGVPYSLEGAPFDVRPFYLFPGYDGS